MKDRTATVNANGSYRHKVYHCPKCKKDWTPLHRTYWRVADTIADELTTQPRDGVMLCNVCEFGVDTRGDIKGVFVP